MGEVSPSTDMQARKMSNTVLHSAEIFLESLLSAGPVRSSEIRRKAIAQGHSWRTVERAAKVLGVASRKDGHVWNWHLPDDRQPAVQDRQDRQDRQETKPRAPDTHPETATRRTRWGPNVQANGWAAGSFQPVRCANCVYADVIEDRESHGWCGIASLRVQYLHANRRCAEFKDYSDEPERATH